MGPKWDLSARPSVAAAAAAVLLPGSFALLDAFLRCRAATVRLCLRAAAVLGKERSITLKDAA